ncbi:hypothetical protein [Flavivirga rizhaonensis]|uniref:Uncharacterized protein n=1 Tax=Flavivirga rizhaonensis TaxID=2559571 RepID=A0A4V3P4X6_9FLAO|nr:hypothetical protein [Flavivirga rizhaonensis]TGV03154.1 hypothetical protein EM932_07535 [Flavivirga rizhaonensis]
METSLKTPIDSKLEQKIKLIDGNFTPSEAADIINNILDVKINFHKIQRLSRTEGNVNDACEYDSSRIVELIDSKHDTKSFLTDARLNGKKLEIESTVTIKVKE